LNSLTNLSPTQLRRAADLQERILELQNELQEIVGAPAETTTPDEPKKKRKKFSAAARARMRKAQRQRRAKIKSVEKL
jgi:hypothetical protein